MDDAKKQVIDKLVPDTSVIIEGIVSKKIAADELKVHEIIIHEAVLAELEHQANMNRSIGYLGLDEINRLKQLDVKMRFAGIRPRAVEIKHASLGEIDALIRALAYEEDAVLITADRVQGRVAEAKNMKCIYIQQVVKERKLTLDRFFDETTMSVHLRENVEPMAKKGKPGSWELAVIRKKVLSHDELKGISREIMEETKLRKDGFIEIERSGSTIIQLGKYRIVITRPPFSDGWEITAVRPIRHLSLADYSLSEKLAARITGQAEGILIAGSPGHGKTTFAQALAEHYAGTKKIVKTIEAPRDLVLPENITQYALSHSDPAEVHDILLLSRPDYTIFDEMRNTNDFSLFADLRLAGVGMVGVVHAASPVDAIQRFIGRTEMGVIPQIVDTVVFIKNGQIGKVLGLHMTAKVPSGMTEEDLARPVIVISDFETGKPEYEIYTYGEETVVMPVTHAERQAAHRLAASAIEQEFRKIVEDVNADVVSSSKCIVYVPEDSIAKIIGKEGKTIEGIEHKLGISIDVRPIRQPGSQSGSRTDSIVHQQVSYETQITKKAVLFYFSSAMAYKDVQLYVGDDFLMTAKVGKSGVLSISRKNKIGSTVADAINSHNMRILI